MTPSDQTIRHGAGFGRQALTFALATGLIPAGAAGVHLENQDPGNRTCGHIVWAAT